MGDIEDLDYYLAMQEEQEAEAEPEPDFWEEENIPEQQPVNTTSIPVTNEAIDAKKTAQIGISSLISHGRVNVAINNKICVDQPVVSKKSVLNHKEFALAMQAERLKAIGEVNEVDGNTPAKSSASVRKLIQLDAESSLQTLRPQYSVASDASKFVHARPPGIAETMSGSHNGSAQAPTGFLSCVLADGSTMYLNKRRRPQHGAIDDYLTTSKAVGGIACAVSSPEARAQDSQVRGLLQMPMAELMREADALKTKALLLRESTMAEKVDRAENGKWSSLGPVGVPASSADGSLWVDKYAPQSFTALLSPEKINREVLKALKKWDSFVFKTRSSTEEGEEGRNAQLGSASKPKAPAAGGASATAESEDTRPRNKVIMLCGPPGTGKTTLAHIVARHCGYTPIEVNASDDRSPERLKELIYSATQNSTLLAAGRPNCVILDEVDGIDGSRNALDVLTNIIKAPLRAAAGAGGTGGASAGKGRSGAAGAFPLTRPLICICNDQYAPALRDLIKLADVFVFSAPQEVRLIQRLRQVCKAEGLHVANSAHIAELCSATGHDIRASINNLQFAALKSQSGRPDPPALLQRPCDVETAGGNWGSAFTGSFRADSATGSRTTAPVKYIKDIGAVLQGMIRNGLKDDSLDLMQVWRQLFTQPVPDSAAATGVDLTSVALTATKTRRIDHSMRAMDAMLSYGDHQQVVAGIHENIHSMEALDPHMNKHSAIAEWLSFSEELNCLMPRARDGFQLSPYVAAVAAAVHCHCAVPAARRPKVEWPRKNKEAHFKGVQRQNILQSLLDGSNLHALQATKQRVALDVLSHLLDVISPPPGVRPLAFITLPVPEQNAILDTVRVMESCGISYTLCRVVDAFATADAKKPFNPLQPAPSLAFKLDPAVDQLLEYGECEELAQRHVSVVPEMRQLLHTEQRKLAIQCKAHKLDGGAGSSGSAMQVTTSHVAVMAAPTTSTPFEIMQQQQQDASGTKRQHSGALASFFTVTAPAPSTKKSKLAAETTANSEQPKPVFNSNSVRFKFNQGFSNAVKRTVLMDEFI